MQTACTIDSAERARWRSSVEKKITVMRNPVPGIIEVVTDIEKKRLRIYRIFVFFESALV